MSVYSKQQNKGKKRHDNPTPEIVCNFLHQEIIKVLKPKRILDPCCGNFNLTKPFSETEIINYEIKKPIEKDFLACNEEIDCDLVLMNPPFNLGGSGKKLAVEVFMDKVLEVIKNKDTPIVLITPMGFRLNQRKKSTRYKKIRDEYPPITGIISLPLDCFDDALFHVEILIFNLKLPQFHYFLNYENEN